jgi:hypothetical protein
MAGDAYPLLRGVRARFVEAGGEFGAGSLNSR